jgi:hypothetical protein
VEAEQAMACVPMDEEDAIFEEREDEPADEDQQQQPGAAPPAAPRRASVAQHSTAQHSTRSWAAAQHQELRSSRAGRAGKLAGGRCTSSERRTVDVPCVSMCEALAKAREGGEVRMGKLAICTRRRLLLSCVGVNGSYNMYTY